MKITVDGKVVEFTRISINAKCVDLCQVQLQDKDDNTVAEHDGYVPEFLRVDHDSDYINLDIDLETGTILNWKRPTRKILEKTKWIPEA